MVYLYTYSTITIDWFYCIYSIFLMVDFDNNATQYIIFLYSLSNIQHNNLSSDRPVNSKSTLF